MQLETLCAWCLTICGKILSQSVILRMLLCLQAIDAIRQGHNVVVSTSTASGKSLCYLLPTLEALAADRNATALFMFPTKALAQVWQSDLGDLSKCECATLLTDRLVSTSTASGKSVCYPPWRASQHTELPPPCSCSQPLA